jgi:hypothetical protein
MYNEVNIIKHMPIIKGAYFLPFHMDHAWRCDAIKEFESKSLTLEDRIRMLEMQSLSGPTVSAFLGDEPVAVFGCVLLWSGVGEAWSLLSEKARRYPIAMTKAAKCFFNNVETQFNLHRLQITVKSTDKRAMGWAKTLGFVSEGLMLQYSADKEDNYIMRKK